MNCVNSKEIYEIGKRLGFADVKRILFLTQPTKMPNLPQNVTVRYVHNLLHLGFVHDFNLEEVTRHPHVVNDFVVGQYFDVRVSNITGAFIASGATPVIACQRALEHMGVTFK